MFRHSETTKYVVIIGDGMADYPVECIGGKTPLEAARTPNMDRIAMCHTGLVRSIPEGMEPGSDVANLSFMGYDPLVCHTGRAPFEAASMGIVLESSDVAFRMNLVCLKKGSDGKIIMKSHSAGDITTPEATQIIKDLRRKMRLPSGINMYQGVAYRHLLVWKDGPESAHTIPPHDVLDQDMSFYLSRKEHDTIVELIRSSWQYLENHPVNLVRRANRLPEANSIWLWGQGRAPRLQDFHEKFGLKGGIISAVDLLKGIGICAGLGPIHVEGATGYIDTNYRGKAEAAVRALEQLDYVFVHIEAPDEAGHSGNAYEKIKAIEAVDREVVGNILTGLAAFDDYRIMVASDHFTPVSKRTHTDEPTIFAWADKKQLETGEGENGNNKKKITGFTEKAALQSGLFFEHGCSLAEVFLKL
jgi:2,3-bisphosphoglycerate-independent phosphoglycerate mutase